MSSENNWKPLEKVEYLDTDDGLFLIHGENAAALYTEETKLQDYDQEVHVVILSYNGNQIGVGKEVVAASHIPGEAEQMMNDISAHDYKNWKDIVETFGDQQ